MVNKAAILMLIGAVALAVPHPLSAGGKPMSAIDWLSDTVAKPPPKSAPITTEMARPQGPLERIVTRPLSDRNLDAVGVLSAQITGMDRRLWAGSSVQALSELIRRDHVDGLPALRDLMQTLMLAQLDAPLDADGSGTFLLVRIDKLLELGALEAASTLTKAAGKPTPELFRRAFDISLLMATEDEACAEQRAMPQIAPTFPARIFCLARGGDWAAAELTLRTARAIGRITPEEDALFERFLAPDEFDDADPLPTPERITPLNLRIYEAIGEPMAAGTLPLAFAHGDLTPASGWKARLEAGERLARTGAIAPAELFELYRERRPAASGGVWTRVSAVQKLDEALRARDRDAIAAALDTAWSVMADQELEVPFAETYWGAINALNFDGEAGALAFRIGLLASEYEKIARARAPKNDMEAFLIGLALGNVSSPTPRDRMARALAPAFFGSGGTAPVLPDSVQLMMKTGRGGEAALGAIERILQGAVGDARSVTEGITVLRQLGLEGAARKTALQLMILERRG